MGLRPTQGDKKRLLSSSHFPWGIALPFVIPSEAEGSAVRGLATAVKAEAAPFVIPTEAQACPGNAFTA
jgi:hypothetical protein